MAAETKRFLSKVPFITSFLPLVVFNVVARVGEVSLARIEIGAALGLVLAGIQLAFSKAVLKQTNYLERAFLGVLAAGTAWVFLAPAEIAAWFVTYFDLFLYLTLFLVTLLPQLFGYDSFTYAIAKQWYPAAVWKTPQFRTINLHITYFWSAVFFFCLLSSWLGRGNLLFMAVVPSLLCLGVGLPFAIKYPGFYLTRQFASPVIDPSAFPSTARELVNLMPLGFSPQAASDLKAEIQFDLSGEGGGKMVLSIADGRCTVRDGEASTPALTIISPADVWLKMARGELNPAKALMDGLYKAEGDMNLLVKLSELFQSPVKAGTAVK